MKQPPGVSRARVELGPLDPGDVARLLGYGDAVVPARARELIAECIAEASPLARPVFAYRRLDRATLAASTFLARDDVDDAAVCLVTIGPDLEERVRHYDEVGELSRALALNVCGSAAAESTADAAERAIRGHVAREGLRCSRRFSPGYGGWDGAEQRWILPYLEAESLGVTLTAGCMMRPAKSVTFAVTVGVNPREMRGSNPCEDCDLTCCSYRRPVRDAEEVTCDPSSYCPLGKWSE